MINFGLYYEENFARLCTFYAYVHFVIVLFFLLCALGNPWANYSAAMPQSCSLVRRLCFVMYTLKIQNISSKRV